MCSGGNVISPSLTFDDRTIASTQSSIAQARWYLRSIRIRKMWYHVPSLLFYKAKILINMRTSGNEISKIHEIEKNKNNKKRDSKNTHSSITSTFYTGLDLSFRTSFSKSQTLLLFCITLQIWDLFARIVVNLVKIFLYVFNSCTPNLKQVLPATFVSIINWT